MIINKPSVTWLLTAGLIASGPVSAIERQSEIFSPAQEARIGEISKSFLLAHPEVLVEVSQKLQEKQAVEQAFEMKRSILRHHSDIVDDKTTPSIGPKNARVVVTEFFDYQCIYCAHLAPLLDASIKANPEVRYMFREWPIFAGRWDRSLTAAKTGIQIWQQKGAEAYLRYHNGIFATGHNEGKLTTQDIWNTARKVGFESGSAKDAMNILDKTSSLAQALGLRGTPGLIVMPVSGATLENVTVFAGMPDATALQAAIVKADSVIKQ